MGDASLVVRPSEDRLSVCTPQGSVLCHRRFAVTENPWFGLLLRLSIRKTDVLRFLTDPRVPFSNNLAERDGRMMKLQQKISGGFRSMDGAMDFAVIRSLLSTARKQGWDILQTLTANPDSLIPNSNSHFGFCGLVVGWVNDGHQGGAARP